MPLASNAGRTASIAASITEQRSTGRSSICNLPVMMRETSSRSSINCDCERALRSIVSNARVTSAAHRVFRCAPDGSNPESLTAACAVRATAWPEIRLWCGLPVLLRRAQLARGPAVGAFFFRLFAFGDLHLQLVACCCASRVEPSRSRKRWPPALRASPPAFVSFGEIFGVELVQQINPAANSSRRKDRRAQERMHQVRSCLVHCASRSSASLSRSGRRFLIKMFQCPL